DLLEPRRIGVGPRHHARGIAGDQAHAGEDDEADDDQRDDRDDDPPDQKVEHGLTGPLSLPDRPPRRVQLRGGARGPLARRTPCTLSVRARAPYLRRWALLGSFQTGRREGSSCEAAPRGPHARRTPCTLSVRTRAPYLRRWALIGGLLLPARALDPDQPVGHRLVSLEAPGVGHDVVLVVEVDDVAPLPGELVDRLAVERGALRLIRHLARLVQQRVDGLVAGPRRVEAPPARLELVDIGVGVDAAAPADQEGPELARVVLVQRGGELGRSQ